MISDWTTLPVLESVHHRHHPPASLLPSPAFVSFSSSSTMTTRLVYFFAPLDHSFNALTAAYLQRCIIVFLLLLCAHHFRILDVDLKLNEALEDIIGTFTVQLMPVIVKAYLLSVAAFGHLLLQQKMMIPMPSLLGNLNLNPGADSFLMKWLSSSNQYV